MKSVRFSFLVPLLAAACGSSPMSPSPTTESNRAAPVVGVSLSVSLTPDSDPTTGWRSPTSVTTQVFDRRGPAIVESATFRMLDDRGNVLTQASIVTGESIPKDAYLSGNAVVLTLAWAVEGGYGKRIDGSVTIRSAIGDLQTVPFSIPAR